MIKTTPMRPTLSELLSPEEIALLEQTLDEVLREHWGPDRHESYTQPRAAPPGLTPLPLGTDGQTNQVSDR